MTIEQKRLNDFKRNYLDPYYKLDWNKINLSKSDGLAHNKMVCDVCVYLLTNNIQFLTQPRFVSGYRPDILVPHGLPYKIIEVRNTETEKKSKEKMCRTPEELQNEILYVDVPLFLEQDFIAYAEELLL